MQIRKTVLASAAAAALSLGMVSLHAATQTVSAASAEKTTKWFVEFNGLPTSEGAKLETVRAEKAKFRQLAAKAGIKFKERRSFDVLFNGLSVDVSPAERAKLARLPGVKALYPVELIQAPKAERALQGLESPQMNTALAMTGADIVQGMGYTGTGIKVGIIDTGIDIDHPNLGGNGTPGGTSFPSNRIPFGYDFVGDAYNADPTSPGYNPIPAPDANPDDCGGHGTHVAGIVGSNGTLTGVAPNVTLGAYRVFGCAGSTEADIMVAAMERALADGMQVAEIGARVHVGDDAAAGVVRSRHYRDRFARDVDAEFAAAREDGREVLGEEFRRLVRHVEEDAVEAVALHFEVDGAGDDVSRREFGTFVVSRHEARAVGQAQQAALAAQGFGDQE